MLRPFRPGDADAMAEVLGDPVSMRFYPRPFSIQEAAEWVERNAARTRDSGLGLWAVTLRATGEVIGDCGAVVQTVDGDDELELAWHLHPLHQGHGYATEAAVAWRDHVFATTDRRRLVSLIVAANLPSRRVAERIGMTIWKTTEMWGRAHLVYAVTR